MIANLNSNPKPITSQLVKETYTYMQSVYGTTVISKTDSAFMGGISTFLSTMGILDKAKFMSSYATTIDKVLYLPFTPGIADNTWSLYSQLVIAVHEHQHVEQWITEGRWTFDSKYLLSKSERARYETEAYRSTLEMSWLYQKRIPDTQAVANALLQYGMDNSYVVAAKGSLDSAARMVKAGVVLNVATRTALSVLV